MAAGYPATTCLLAESWVVLENATVIHTLAFPWSPSIFSLSAHEHGGFRMQMTLATSVNYCQPPEVIAWYGYVPTSDHARAL